MESAPEHLLGSLPVQCQVSCIVDIDLIRAHRICASVNEDTSSCRAASRAKCCDRVVHVTVLATGR